MKNLKNMIFSGLLICLISCSAGTNITSSIGGGGNFNEDLSAFRPTYKMTEKKAEEDKEEKEPDTPFEPAKDATASLNRTLSSIAENAPASARGFRIQVYSGNSSDQAKAIKAKAEKLVCNEPVYIDYRIPNFRVRIGNAISRIEANYILSRVKKSFPDAMVVPENSMELKLKECN